MLKRVGKVEILSIRDPFVVSYAPSRRGLAMVDAAVKIYERRSIERGSKQQSTIEATPKGDTH
jgi:hypothetical protein